MKRQKPPRFCRVPGCGAQIQRGYIMCRSHWFSLPRQLRAAIRQTWRTRDKGAYVRNVRAAERLALAEAEADD